MTRWDGTQEPYIPVPADQRVPRAGRRGEYTGRYYVRTKINDRWSCIVILGPGAGARTTANRIADEMRPHHPTVRVFTTRQLLHHDGWRAVNRAIEQSQFEWDGVQAIFDRCRPATADPNL